VSNHSREIREKSNRFHEQKLTAKAKILTSCATISTRCTFLLEIYSG